MINKTWLKAAGIRAIRTMVQVAIPLLPAGTVVWEVDWRSLIGIVLTTGIISILTSAAGLPEVESEDK